jgi:lipopolysaccharide transport system ATP-binding protein
MSDDRAPSSARVVVRDLSRTFVMAEQDGGPASLWATLRGGPPTPQQRCIEALSGISFSIGEGERVGIIGRNGAGKTSLLSILAGITQPSAGTIDISGDVHAMLTIGAVLKDEATGRENIQIDGAFHGRSTIEMAALTDEIIAFAELGEFIDRPVRTYSSGMKARLAFSMGAFIDPDILIIDETLSVGDAFFSAKASERMRAIAARGRIVIMVSHALGSIVEMCSRCLWLDRGRLIMDGDPATVTAAYTAAVNAADEEELARKFGQTPPRQAQTDRGRLDMLTLTQDGKALGATAQAFRPLTIAIGGAVARPTDMADLLIEMIRVDGRTILSRRLSGQGLALRSKASFSLKIMMDPFILGADLYRLTVTLCDAAGPIDSLARVVEVLDEAGQFGGTPLLFHPPHIIARRLGEAS